MEKHLLVFGGSGFLGQEICRKAAERYIPVISVSRRGNQEVPLPLKNDPLVRWIESDIFSDTNWHAYIKDSFCIVNSIGLLLEDDEKGLTYNKLNIKANEIIVDQIKETPAHYLYLSANGNSPFASPNYIQSKRIAEDYIQNQCNSYTIIRPGLVVGKERPSSYFNGLGIKLLTKIPYIKRKFEPVYPIPIQDLAEIVMIESKAKGKRLLANIR